MTPRPVRGAKDTTTKQTKDRENHLFREPAAGPEPEVCDVCGAIEIVEIKCKAMCRNCGTILRSCSDL